MITYRAQTHTPDEGRRHIVMVLSGDRLQSDLTVDILNGAGIDVVLYSLHNEFPPQTLDFVPDVIVADWDREGIDGRAEVSDLKKRFEKLKPIPVILMTDRTIQHMTRMQLAEGGFEWILEKPVVATSLPRLVQRCILEAYRKSRRRVTTFVQLGETASCAVLNAVK